MREHLEAIERGAPGRIVPELHPDPLPPCLEGLWDVFLALSSARAPAGMGGVAPLSYRDLVAFQDVTGIRLTPWEASALREADLAAMAALTKKA